MFVDDDDYDCIVAGADDEAQTIAAFNDWLTHCLKGDIKEYSTHLGPGEFAYTLAGLEKCILLDLIDHSEGTTT